MATNQRNINTDHDAVLIVDCPVCVDPKRGEADGRTVDGFREWTAAFRSVPDPEHPGFNMLEPVNERDLCCPECGHFGRVLSLLTYVRASTR